MSDLRIILFDLKRIKGILFPAEIREERNGSRTKLVSAVSWSLGNSTEDVMNAIKVVYKDNCICVPPGDKVMLHGVAANQQAEELRLYKRLKLTCDWHKYTRTQNEYKSKIINARRGDFKAFCENISEATCYVFYYRLWKRYWVAFN